MRVRAGVLVVGMLAAVGCSGIANPLGRQYEYEEQVYLSISGGASVNIVSSIPALVALRGAALDPSSAARIDQAAVQKVFEKSGCKDIRQVGSPWRRKNRWFIEVRIEAADVRTLSQCGMVGWSTYVLERDEAGLHYEQTVAAAAGGNPGKVNWDGSELVAFRLHLPSRIVWHNVKLLDRENENGNIARGNILTWEQHLADRRAGKPVHMDVRMETESILRRTLTLFAGAFVSAIAALGAIIWLTIRKGRARARASA